MAYRFTPAEPIQYHQFDFEKFLNYSILNSSLRELPFIQEWKNQWNLILKHQDDYIKHYIENHPDTNPMWERAKANPKQFENRNEMFIYEFNANNGDTYYFHYDVEKMKRLAANNQLNKVTLNRSQFFLDKETIYEESRANNNSLPFFAPVFAVREQYVVVDGNKRVMAKIKKGEHTFTGYVFTPQQVIESYFFQLDGWFYVLLAEMVGFLKSIFFKEPYSEIKNQSIIFQNR